MHLKLFSLRTAIALTTTIAILSPASVIAQDDDKTIDMLTLTCADFDDLGRMEKVMSLVWLSGWTAQQQGNTTFTPDRGAMRDRQDALKAACEDNEQALVMEQLL
ncbi:MAG: HdeA/HdeB family chaperone [Cyanobacteria bacterium P01_C01_bin.72]